MENRPLLEVFTTCWQECKTVMELVSFYRERVPDCLITVMDNMSTDDTEKFCKENNVNFTTFDTGNKMDEATLIKLRNNSWKNSKAHYVIVCDSDELIDVSEVELVDNLQNPQWTVTKCKGVELFGNNEFFKDAKEGIYSEGYSKKALWLKDAVKDMNLHAGSHNADPIANEGYSVVYNENPPILYHTKWQSWQHGLDRQNQIKAKGVSSESKAKGWNYHFSLGEQDHKNYWNNGYNNRVKVK